MSAVAGSVSRVRLTPLTLKVVDALPVTVPGLADVNVTPNWPEPLVTPLIGPAGSATAPSELVSETTTFAPTTRLKPVTPSPPWLAFRPSFFSTVTVNVWGARTGLTPSGVILIRASTNRLIAGQLLPL